VESLEQTKRGDPDSARKGKNNVRELPGDHSDHYGRWIVCLQNLNRSTSGSSSYRHFRMSQWQTGRGWGYLLKVSQDKKKMVPSAGGRGDSDSGGGDRNTYRGWNHQPERENPKSCKKVNKLGRGKSSNHQKTKWQEERVGRRRRSEGWVSK